MRPGASSSAAGSQPRQPSQEPASQARLDGAGRVAGKVAASGEQAKPVVDLLVGSISCLPPPMGPA